ncbi:unnamed protein product [Blepharisma stoltei]|uniref:Uncharacterized protein n=1 Tax=Blepharisma stoltei TaxID=1481888 RepID=A0AAU9JMH2_9CILI|nr:unnamed protein product [Blepharisma stoltei]
MNKYSDLYQRPFTSSVPKNLYGSPKSFSTNRPITTGFQSTVEALSNEKMFSPFTSTWETFYSPLSTYVDTQQSAKSIDDSQYQISVNFPERPNTSSISGLTLLENERAINNSKTLLTTKERVSFPNIFSNTQQFPAEKDFNRILNKIEMIVSNKYLGHRGATIKEGEPIEIMSEQSSFSYLKVYTKGKRCPMRVHFKKSKGKLLTYISRHNPEPSESLHDEVFKTDSFEVADPGLKFKNDYIHFGIQALEDSTFVISVYFGRLKIDLNKKRKTERQETSIELENLRKNEMLQYELFKKVDDTIAKRKSEQLKNSNNKDFLKMNMNILPINSPKRMKEKTVSLKNIELRRKSAKIKHKLWLQEKKQRAINVVNKKLLRAEEEKQERLRKEQLILLQNEQKEWFIVINIALAFVSIREKWQAKRKEKLETFKNSISARKFQIFFRARNHNKTISEFVLLRAKDTLNFYFRHAKPIERRSYRRQISKCIHESARNHTLPHHFSAFTESIFNVQKVWREYNEKNKKRWEELNLLWNQELEKKILELNKAKPTKGKKKKDESAKYLKIPAIARNHVLTEYFRDRKRNFRVEIRKFIDKKKMQKVLKQFSKFSQSDLDTNKAELIFKYLPSEEDMLQLIEKALHITNITI